MTKGVPFGVLCDDGSETTFVAGGQSPNLPPWPTSTKTCAVRSRDPFGALLAADSGHDLHYLTAPLPNRLEFAPQSYFRCADARGVLDLSGTAQVGGAIMTSGYVMLGDLYNVQVSAAVVGHELEQSAFQWIVLGGRYRSPVQVEVEPLGLSEHALRERARVDPMAIVLLLRQDPPLRPSDLTFVAEIAGEINDSALVVPALWALLEHHSGLVREGVVYGLAQHLSWTGVRARLQAIAASDPSSAVREAASDSLS